MVKKGSEHSFGIEVAKMSGIPLSIIKRANQIMQKLSLEKNNNTKEKTIQNYQLTLFDSHNKNNLSKDKIIEKIQAIDINTLSPVEALLQINGFKKLLAKN